MKKALLQLGPCPQCGKYFESRYIKINCSLECYLKSDSLKERLRSHNEKKENQVEGTCPQCKKKFMSKASRKQRFCSKNHYRAYMAERFDRWFANPETIQSPQAFDEFLTQYELPCLIDGCDWHGKNLGHHVNFAHGITARDFKKLCGFNLTTGLVTPELSEHLSSRPHLAFASPPPQTQDKIAQKIAARDSYVSHERVEHWRKARALAGATHVNVERACVNCGETISVGYNQHNFKYCSIKCRAAHSASRQPYTTMVCARCAAPFQTNSKGQLKRSNQGLPVFDRLSCRQSYIGQQKSRAKSVQS